MDSALEITLIAFALGGVGLYAASWRAGAGVRRARLIKFVTYFAIVAVVIACCLGGQSSMIFLALAIAGGGAYELYGSLRQRPGRFRTAVYSGYTLLSIALVCFAIFVPPRSALYTYLIVAGFDGFSQVVGQLFGRRRIARRVSPTKTLEGAIGGTFAALALTLVLRSIAGLSTSAAVLSSIGLVTAAFAGDLTASWIKRKSGIKDFGRLLPGHGGVLDRFDSLMLAAPVAMIFFH